MSLGLSALTCLWALQLWGFSCLCTHFDMAGNLRDRQNSTDLRESVKEGLVMVLSVVRILEISACFYKWEISSDLVFWSLKWGGGHSWGSVIGIWLRSSPAKIVYLAIAELAHVNIIWSSSFPEQNLIFLLAFHCAPYHWHSLYSYIQVRKYLWIS